MKYGKWNLGRIFCLVVALVLVASLSFSLPTKKPDELFWTAPTTDVNGNPLGDLDGYFVYWSAVSDTYIDADRYEINGAGNTSIKFADIGGSLPANVDNIYFVITAKDTGSNESVFSNQVQYAPFVVPAAPATLGIR